MPSSPYNIENDLLAQVASGNEQAFKTLFDTYHQRLFQYILSLTKSKEIAEELVMDVFMKLWNGKEIVTEIENMDAFLFRIAHNKSIDFLRTAARDKRVADFIWDRVQLPESANPDQVLVVKEYEARLREAVESLSPQRKKVYKLSREGGLSHAEIADELKISKNTVTNHIMEAQSFIRNYLIRNLDIVVIMTVLSKYWEE